MLLIESLDFAYEKKSILKGVSFSISRGEIVALIGISGSGKTTLFRLITGLIQPLKGKITTPPTTYMRQEDLLLPWRTVIKNLLLLSELGKSKKEVYIREAYAFLKRVGLEGYEEAYPHELSGGMRQRVALVRSLLQDRPLLLLDEPFASLDVIHREVLYALVREMAADYGKTIVMVTHDFRDALQLADRILILSQGQIASDCRITSEVKEDPRAAEILIRQIREKLLHPDPHSSITSL